MTATLPSDLREIFERARSAELVTVDERGRPVLRAVAPSYHQGEHCIDVQVDLEPDPQVALLFADEAPMVLVQGIAQPEGILHIRPERVYVWPHGGGEDPRLYDAHLEEVLSGHNEEPEVGHADPEGGAGLWDERLDHLSECVLACVGPDGFPFAVRLAVSADREAGVLRFPRVPVGMPVEPGPGCAHCDGGTGTRVQGDLAVTAEGWMLVPQAVVAG